MTNPELIKAKNFSLYLFKSVEFHFFFVLQETAIYHINVTCCELIASGLQIVKNQILCKLMSIVHDLMVL